MLFWNKAQPCSEIAPLVECGAISNGGDHSGGNKWTHARDRQQSLASCVLLSNGFDLSAQFFDLNLDRLPLLPEMIEQVAHAWSKVHFGIFQYAGHLAFEISTALAISDAALQQKSPHLVDHAGAPTDESI